MEPRNLIAFAALAACTPSKTQMVPSTLLPQHNTEKKETPIYTFEQKFSYVLDQGYRQGRKSNSGMISQMAFPLGDTYVTMIVRDINNDAISDLEFIVSRKGSNDRLIIQDMDLRTPGQDHPDTIRRYISAPHDKVDIKTPAGKEFVHQIQDCYLELVDVAYRILHGAPAIASDKYVETYTTIMLPQPVVPVKLPALDVKSE